MVLKLLPGRNSLGGVAELDMKGLDRKGEEVEHIEEKEDADPIIETLGEIGR